MKKISCILTAVVFLAGIMTFGAQAYSTRTYDIPSVRITVNTGELAIGDELSDDASPYVSCPDNDYYHIDEAMWLDDVHSLKVGDSPRMKVFVYAEPKEVYYDNYSKLYLFKSAYTSSNVHITKGSFLSADRRDSGYTLEVTLRIDPVKGKFDPPESVSWKNDRGGAVWEPADNNSGYYDLTLYRGNTTVKKVTSYQGTYYDFYPYMTKAGFYSYKVRSVPAPATDDEKSGGTNSDWLESMEQEISESMVSDGTGQTDVNGIPGGSLNYPEGTGNSDVSGWVHQNGKTCFRYPNGEIVKDGWLRLNGKWYMFDRDGILVKGWSKNKYGKWFYLDPGSGEMKTGWLQDGGKWYYLNDNEGDQEGSLVTGWWSYKGQWYYFNENGVMVSGWYPIGGKWYYFYPEGSTGGLYGYMAANTTIGVFRIGPDGTWQE